MKTLNDVTLDKQRVLMRLDLNVPLKDGEITSDARIQAALPTIREVLAHDASVMIMAHLGRPKEGEYDETLSLAPVAAYLSKALGQDVRLVKDYLDNPPEVGAGEVVLLENVRFNVGEKKDDEALAKAYAALCDVFVSDGFGVVHRAQASTHGVAKFAPQACAGLLVEKEVRTLEALLHDPKRPMLAIVGGAKVSSKLLVLKSLLEKVDVLIPGGGIANTFLQAAGYEVGSSLSEPDLLADAKAMINKAKARGVTLLLPEDVVVAKAFAEDAEHRICALDEIQSNEMILDIGPKSAARYEQAIAKAGTIVWNGPVGVFEMAPFAAGTKALSEAIAASDGFSFAGGGDTIAAIGVFGVENGVDYVSTGGGSMLEYLEGKTLPGIAVLS
ncbi:phosphoglycerate kinase [Suttonella sp. R2A3]|uniref:phosphoglycerate kinase n=1 Tax=Suttonella sp. R2A3 TaxID=2908648 RepID=UPI001F4281CF|nr:phosphoglycerate kinase [Suttonella sp. R2A3]UJF25168.1 phosphoglycerate kinase [Suttonella sp. R2A3]